MVFQILLQLKHLKFAWFPGGNNFTSFYIYIFAPSRLFMLILGSLSNGRLGRRPHETKNRCCTTMGIWDGDMHEHDDAKSYAPRRPPPELNAAVHCCGGKLQCAFFFAPSILPSAVVAAAERRQRAAQVHIYAPYMNISSAENEWAACHATHEIAHSHILLCAVYFGL
jgi:hypothetical protein